MALPRDLLARDPTLDRAGRTPAVAIRSRFRPGFHGDWHASAEAQLIYPSRGVMTLHTRAGAWIIPPLRACWLPAFDEHRVEAPRGLEIHSVYCRGPVLCDLPGERGVVAVSGLLRELILALEAGGPADRHARLALVFADQVVLQQPAAPTVVPLRTPRLDPIEDALRRDPSDPRTLEDWAAELGLASRTLARTFWRAAGMTFTDYRNQVRLHAGLERLARGEPVTTIAHELGFNSASSFITMFKRATGVTPKAYFAPPAHGPGRPDPSV
jgi:AraC-like DNA-binding protein